MKIFSIRSSCGRPNGLPRIGLALTLFAAISGCASSDLFLKQASSSLPMEIIHGGSGQIVSFRAHETSNRLYVAGTARPILLKSTTHVDVQLIGPGGNIIAERKYDIEPLHPRSTWSRGGHRSYVASFPLSEAPRAAKIRVIYHGEAHRGANS